MNNGSPIQNFTLFNIIDNGNILCEVCQEPIKEYVEELILNVDVLVHKQCWETEQS